MTSLILFALVATLTPGGATTLVVSSGATFGFRRSLPLMAGIALGLATLAACAAAGLAGVLLAVPSLQLAMRIGGTAYLLWLTLGIARSGAPQQGRADEQPSTLLGGAGLLWLNPKAWAMALGAAASFAALHSSPLGLAMLLGTVFGAAAMLSLSAWCLVGLIVARIVKTPRQWSILNKSLALLLAASIVPMWL